ncbi:MAG: hypothetical protein P9L88_02485 [Candidatus Tantalella remota]|nr:hypothetical protein [Candidatus Tantalella remota]
MYKNLIKKTRCLSVLVAAFLLVSVFAFHQAAYAEMSDTAKYGIGGGLIGALAGSMGGKAGMGALVGGGAGLALGAISDSSKSDSSPKQDQAVQDAYSKGVKDGKRVNYNEDADGKHIDKFGDDMKN